MTTTNTARRGFGWRPDLPDHRDLAFSGLSLAPGGPAAHPLPSRVDLRDKMPPVYDQGQLGSCTANAIAGALQFLDVLEGEASPPVPSRLFIYFNERQLEGTITSDAGAAIRDGIKSVVKQGTCPEELWPYNIAQFAVHPPVTCYTAAKTDRVTSYLRIRRLSYEMAACLAQGFPFVFGFSVFDSFMSDQVAATGIVPMPAPGEALQGGHAMLAVGYDQARSVFIVRNSWGPSWGDQGYAYMPYAYLTNGQLAGDLWTLRRTSA